MTAGVARGRGASKERRKSIRRAPVSIDSESSDSATWMRGSPIRLAAGSSTRGYSTESAAPGSIRPSACTSTNSHFTWRPSFRHVVRQSVWAGIGRPSGPVTRMACVRLIAPSANGTPKVSGSVPERIAPVPARRISIGLWVLTSSGLRRASTIGDPARPAPVPHVLVAVKTAVYLSKLTEYGEELAAKDLTDVVELLRADEGRVEAILAEAPSAVAPTLRRIWQNVRGH